MRTFSGKVRRFTLSLCGLFFFLQWRSARAHQFQDQFKAAQRAEITVADRSLTRSVSELVSLIGFITVPGQHSQPTPTSLGQGCLPV